MKYRVEWMDHDDQPGEPVVIEADSPDEAVMKAWSADRPHIIRVTGGGGASGAGPAGSTGGSGGGTDAPNLTIGWTDRGIAETSPSDG